MSWFALGQELSCHLQRKTTGAAGIQRAKMLMHLMFKAPASYSRSAFWDCCWDANSEERPERGTRTDPDRVETVPPQGSICDDNYTGGHLVWGNQSTHGLLTMTLHYNPCSIMLHMVPDSTSSAEFSGRNKCLLVWIKNCIPCK